jgi:hypothetical protein
MIDPATIGALTASLLSMGAEEVVKTLVSEPVKDAYKTLKAKVAVWVNSDVEALERVFLGDPNKACVFRQFGASPMAKSFPLPGRHSVHAHFATLSSVYPRRGGHATTALFRKP